jgi:hypothetical protein
VDRPTGWKRGVDDRFLGLCGHRVGHSVSLPTPPGSGRLGD